jgi:Protein of unknown function (DUF1203)
MASTTPVATRIQIHAIDTAVLRELNERDDAGHQPWRLTDAEGGNPLRCCLRRSQPGEQVALVSYAPLRRWATRTGAEPGPYEELGPVFIHPLPCDGPAGAGFPPDLLGSHWVLRAYLADGRILSGRLLEAAEASDAATVEAILAQLLDDPDIAIVHVRAVEFGCFQFEVSRA